MAAAPAPRSSRSRAARARERARDERRRRSAAVRAASSGAGSSVSLGDRGASGGPASPAEGAARGRDVPQSVPGTASRFHVHGLDALRALAVAAVVIYHVHPGLLPGGFMGVDVFFVVSGFLITTLLLRERTRTGRVDLARFWIRRARRLLPALAAVVLVGTAAATLADPDLRVGIGRQVLGAATFSTNWLEIAFGSSYFDHTAPALFMNFWSLAVEEQFYLVWPLVFLLLLRLVRRPAVRAGLALAAAAASALAMGLLVVPGQDATRVYYGTDTHSFGLFFGIALAFVWQAGRGPLAARLANGAPAARALPRLAFGAGLVLLAFCLWRFSEHDVATYRGGLVLASLGSLLVVLSQLGPVPVLGRALESAPLVWVGQRSYGIYLWHWPALVLLNSWLRTEQGGPGWWGVQALAVALTVLLAAASEKWLERPIRRDGFRAVARRLVGALRSGAPRAAATAASGLTVLALLGTAAAGVATAPSQTRVQQDVERSRQLVARSQEEALERAAAAAQHPDASAAPTSTGTASPGKRFPHPSPEQITLIGDSMIAVSADGLAARFPGALIDGVPNRKWDEAERIVDGHLADRTLSRYVVIDFGTNGGIPDEAVVRRILDKLGPDRAVVLVTIYGQSTFIDPANELLKDLAKDRPNVAVADWNPVAAQHPEYLQSDQTHPNIEGANVFAGVVDDAFGTLATGRK